VGGELEAGWGAVAQYASLRFVIVEIVAVDGLAAYGGFYEIFEGFERLRMLGGAADFLKAVGVVLEHEGDLVGLGDVAANDRTNVDLFAAFEGCKKVGIDRDVEVKGLHVGVFDGHEAGLDVNENARQFFDEVFGSDEAAMAVS